MSPEALTPDTVPLDCLTTPPEDRLYLRNITLDLPTDHIADIARYVVGSEAPDPVVYYPVKARGEVVNVPTVDQKTASTVINFLMDLEDRRA